MSDTEWKNYAPVEAWPVPGTGEYDIGGVRYVRAALRSDSPASTERCAACNATGSGEPAFLVCPACLQVAEEAWQAASTGGERDEQDREHDMDLGYARGWNDACEDRGLVTIEFARGLIEQAHMEGQEYRGGFFRRKSELTPARFCAQSLLPRPQVGDPNDGCDDG